MNTGNRLLYLDWMRGLAAVVMLQGHVFHSFLRNDLRTGGPYVFSQFVGGMPPAVFLFLTGITLAFLMHSQDRKGLNARARWWGAVRRASYLLLIAYLFRVQLWTFSRIFSSSNNPWQEMLKVDVLNCMGFGIALFAFAAVLNVTQRMRICAALGLIIAIVSPLVTQWGGAIQPTLLRDYLVPNSNYFSFFPWAAFIAFGISFGSLLRKTRQDRLTPVMQWTALAGAAMCFFASALAIAGPTLYDKSDFWLDNPTLVFTKLGVLLIVVAFSFVWLMQPSAQGWSWVRQLGTTSLIVYWVHIELVYGHWLGWMKSNLSVSQVLLAAICIIAAMIALSYASTSWPQWKRGLPQWWAGPQPQRVSGD